MTNTTALDPHLENGASATTPSGDNLLTDFVAADAAAFCAIADSAGGHSAVDDDLGLIMGDAGSPCHFGNVAYSTRPLDADTATEAVRRIREFYAAGPGGPFILFTPWSLGDLRGDGFELGGHPPLMVRPASAATPDARDVRLVDARSAHEIAEFDQTLAEAYPAEALLPYGTQPALFTEPINDTPWRLITAYIGDQPVATAGAYATDHVVAVDAISTRASFRQRGLGALVTAAAAATAPDLPAALLSSDAGRPVYERLGFLPVTRFTIWLGAR